MRVTYTPFLHAKDGEFAAVAATPADQRDLLLPLFELPPFTDKVRALVAYRHAPQPIAAYLQDKTGEVAQAFAGRPVMVDTNHWTETDTTETGELAVTYAIQALRDRGHPVVPVVGLLRFDESEEYRLALQSVAFEGEPTWALRLDASDMEDAADPDHFIERINGVLQGLGVMPKHMGVLMDFEDVSGQPTDGIVTTAERVLQLLGPSGFQFFSLIGCSMPATINLAVKKHNSEGTVTRKEMLAWRRLRAAYPQLPLAFGDYGVRGPRSSDAPNPYTNGKIRYTIENQYFIVRGEPRKADDEQMHTLAAKVAASAHYLGPDFSHGDRQLHLRAVRTMVGKRVLKLIRPGGTTSWIEFDTSHHLAWLHRELLAAEHAIHAVPVDVAVPIA